MHTVGTWNAQNHSRRATYSKGLVAFGKRIPARRLKSARNGNQTKPVAVPPTETTWLDQGVKEDIFKKVPDREAITWCSPLVVQPKPKFTEMKSEELEPHMIRASMDMRFPNQSMKRSRCVQSPRVEDFIYCLHDCKIFTKLDLRQG